MAWRLSQQLVEGELDNTERNLITGWMTFVGIKGRVTFRLTGNFHTDIAGCRIRLRNPRPSGGAADVKGLSKVQRGAAGDITAGLSPKPYVDYPYIEWHSQANGRVVLELAPDQVEIVAGPVWQPKGSHTAQVRKQSQEQFTGFLESLSKAAGCPAVGLTPRKPGFPPEVVN